MVKTKTQGFVFSLIMSYAMATGMEVYNIAISHGYQAQAGGLSGMDYAVFAEALREAAFMGIIVLILSSLWGNRAGAYFASRHCDPERDNPYFCRLVRQAGTVMAMCPTMSLVASILFSVVLGGEPLWRLPVIWAGTLLKNFPMAFFWCFFAAAPFTHWLFGRIYVRSKA